MYIMAQNFRKSYGFSFLDIAARIIRMEDVRLFEEESRGDDHDSKTIHLGPVQERLQATQ